MKQLIIHQPEDPISFLIQDLENRDYPQYRYVVTGNPGSDKKHIATKLADFFQWTIIHTGDLLKDEIDRKTDMGKEI